MYGVQIRANRMKLCTHSVLFNGIGNSDILCGLAREGKIIQIPLDKPGKQAHNVF